MRILYFVSAVTIGVLCGGCWESSSETGYLSDYSNLQEVSGIASVEGSTFRYSDTSSVFVKGKYNAFILDPVIVQFQQDSKAALSQSKGKLKSQDVNDLIAYFYSAIIDAVNDSGYKIVYRAGAGIGRIRVAITELTKTNIVFAAVPTARVTTGLGRGGAAIESEMVDSVSGKQILACMESTPGSRIPFTGLSDWGGAKHAMDEWVSQFRKDLKRMKSAETQS
ncbi:MAG: hypothetical protein A2Y12_17545 [Planctomycetes bacterium GWF2_42_9]|nr:MAG: hypothetical protein A2Y12_17545 [Planctomycetes bacterium GWF2_42_9]HAL45023.1 hypothetical protein [Phycisphaerales bacterium]